MVSDPVKERMIEAGMYLDEAAKLGDDPQAMGLLIGCDGVLEHIKLFVHDDEAWQQISAKEKDLNKLFWDTFNKDAEKIKTDGEYFKFLEMRKIEVRLLLWKCRQKISFYDWLTQKYDI